MKDEKKVLFKEVALTDDIIKLLIELSREWEKENITYGYTANSAEDLYGNRVFIAYYGAEVIGYLFGHCFSSQQMQSVMPENTRCFEAEEFYIIPNYRSRGIGKALFSFVEDIVKNDAEYIVLSTATKNRNAILHFYIDEVEMELHSARLFKKIS